MCTYSDFRTTAKDTFWGLVVSTAVATKGSCTAVEQDYYTVTVAGGAIGSQELTATATSPQLAINLVLRQVIQARRQVRAAAEQRDRSRRGFHPVAQAA